MSNYFELDWDPEFPGPWWLGEVTSETAPIDCRIFTYGVKERVDGRLRVPIRELGQPLALTFAAFSVPIATREIADIFEKFAPEALQRFPVWIDGLPQPYQVLNVVNLFDAVDRERSSYVLWRPQDGRPDKEGDFRQFDRMIFRRDITPPPHLFRVKGWKVVLVVSRPLMDALGGAALRGVKFSPIEQ